MGSFLSSGNSTISAPPQSAEKIDLQLSENKPDAEIMKTPKEDPKPVTNPATPPLPPKLDPKSTSSSKSTGPKATVTAEPNSPNRRALKRKNMDDTDEEDENNTSKDDNNNNADNDDENNDSESNSESEDIAFEITNDTKASDEDDDEENDPNENTESKKLPSNEVFKGITFAISGLLSQSHAETVEMIKGHGGGYASAFNKKVTHLITTEDEIESRSKKVEAAKEAGMKIISEEYLHDCIHESARLDEKDYSLVKESNKKRKTES